MERIRNLSHPITALPYTISRMLERASYYGLRSLIVLYMIGETLNMERTEALSIYAFITTALLFSQVIGGVLGDLLIGNKRAIIIGGIVQATGAFCIWIPNTVGLYLGLFLVILGTGLFTPNIISNFGKLYLPKKKLLDSGFTLFYLVINLGAFFGVLMIGYIGEVYGYTLGFIVSGLISLLSAIPVLLTKEKEYVHNEVSKSSFGTRFIYILIVFITVGIFWGVYELTGSKMYEIQMSLSGLSENTLPNSFWESINVIFILPISILFIILWTFWYTNSFTKLLSGCILGVMALGILIYIPEAVTVDDTTIYLVALGLLGISEILIGPMLQSIVTRYANPKYLAILVSLGLVPIKVFILLFGQFNYWWPDSNSLSLKLGIAILLFMSIGLSIFVWFYKRFLEDDQ